jgi:membrane fusion protein (multidrug efflux system)
MQKATLTSIETNDIDAVGTPARTAPPNPRKKMFALLAAAVVAAGATWGGYEFLVAAHYVSTENAYVGAETAQITPAVGGTVREVRVIDTQAVKKGDVLVVIDDTDARLEVERTAAELQRAERRVRGYLATDEGYAAQLQARDAENARASAQLASARAELERTRLDLKRREDLAGSGSVSGEEVSNARTAFLNAEAALRAAQAALAQAAANRDATNGAFKANRALTVDTTVETNPEVALARAAYERAEVDLKRTMLRAPVDGVVARRQVQVGQRVQAGTALLSVVPLQDVHVDANFKEVQLKDVAVGQPVELKSDLYGRKVVYHGTVAGFAGGTGSAFALIPSQNATGNWLKVVQRLPVRIKLDANELRDHPLNVGLSMTATIDTRPQASSTVSAR